MKEPDAIYHQTSKPKKFNAKCFFQHNIPYDDFFAERVPLLQTFKLALENYYSAMRSNKWWQFKKQRPFTLVECGVYVGASLLSLAKSVHDARIPYTIHALDTFSGFPPLSDKDKFLAPDNAPYLRKSLFNDTSLEEVKTTLSEQGFINAIYYHEGLFEETLPNLSEACFDFVNIDCDLYESHMTCLHYFYPRMRKGGIMFFDDYYSKEYPMAKVAIDEFMKDKPEQLLHLRFGKEETNHTKVYLVKYDE